MPRRHTPPPRRAAVRSLFPLRGFLTLYTVVVASVVVLIRRWTEVMGTLLGSDATSLVLPVAALIAMAVGAWLGFGAARRIGMALLVAVVVLALLAVFILFADWSIQFILRSAVQLAEPPQALWLRGLVLSLTPAMLCGLFIAMFAAGLRRHSGLAPAALSARLLALGGVGAMSAIPITALPWDGDFERSLLLPVVGVTLGGLAVLCYGLFRRFWPIGERLSWSSMPSSAEPLPATLLPVVGVAAGAIFCTWRELALLWDAWYGASAWLTGCCSLALALGAAFAWHRKVALPAPSWLLLAGCAIALSLWLFAPAVLFAETLATSLPQASTLAYILYCLLAACCLALLALPTVVLGAVLPALLGDAVQRAKHDGGWGHGLSLLWLGIAFGVALAWSHLIPSIGFAAGAVPAVILLSWSGIAGLLVARIGAPVARRAVTAVIALLVGGAALAAPSPLLGLTAHRAQTLGEGAQLLWQRHGYLSTAQLYQYHNPPLRALFVNGRQRALTAELPLVAALGLSTATGLRHALAIGADANTGALLASRALLRLDLLEPDAVVLEGLHALAPQSSRVLLDPRVHRHSVSPRRFLLSTSRHYGLIVSSPLGDGRLYSREFYQLVNSRLNSGGIFVQGLPPLGEQAFIAVYKALSHSFSDLALVAGGGRLVVIARHQQSLEPLSPTLWEQPWTRDFFASQGLGHADELRVRFVGSRIWLNGYYLALPGHLAQDSMLLVSQQLARAHFTGGQQQKLLALRGSDGISLSAELSPFALRSSAQELSVLGDPPDLYFAERARALAEALEHGGDDLSIPAVAALSRPCAAAATVQLCGDDWLRLAREHLLPLLPWLSDGQAVHLVEALQRWRRGRQFSDSAVVEYQLLLALSRRDWSQVAELAASLLPPDDQTLATEDDRRHVRTALLAHFLQFELAEVMLLGRRLLMSSSDRTFPVDFALQTALGYTSLFQHVTPADTAPP